MEEIKKIPSRDQIPAEDKWAVEDLYCWAAIVCAGRTRIPGTPPIRPWPENLWALQ